MLGLMKPLLKMGRRWLKDCQRNAVSRQINWELTDEQFYDLVSRECHYCGTPPMQQVRIVREERRLSKEKLNGIDRVNSDLGYVISNCVPCCKNCNFAKLTFSEQDFIAHCEKIIKHWRSK